ncbi:MAG: DNA-directed RNA polymerase subunit beta', partial [Alphaproteobacteria bacterium]|nr:DNA-directed RNA polymerase subunit beta' [Alphaproteobacteria bacterium]
IYHLTYERKDIVDLESHLTIADSDAFEHAIGSESVILLDAKTDDDIAVSKATSHAEVKELFQKLTKGEINAYRIPYLSNFSEIEHALTIGRVHIQQRIKTIYHTIDTTGAATKERVITTAGRAMLGNILPKHPFLRYDLVNQLLTKRHVTNLIDVIYRHTGQKETVIFSDVLMKLGFEWACRSGVSLGKDDLIIPESKQEFIDKTQAVVEEFEAQYQQGLITGGEKYNKVVDAWSSCTDQIAGEMMKAIQNPKDGLINAVYMMADSGARGSATQIKQLAGMRGLMAKPSGEIIERPIISNFKEGLTVLEYFNSTHGARKGLADTALKTANSGYMTRKLVDVAQNAVINGTDCGTDGFLEKTTVMDGGDIIEALSERILGRVLARDVVNPENNVLVAPRGTLVDEKMAENIERIGVTNVSVRSVIKCKNKIGVCAMCYGRDLSRGTLVNEGEAIGVIAAQSIGEPGTQLTMRTFHIGGVVQGGAEQSHIESAADGTVTIVGGDLLIRDQRNNLVVMGRSTEIHLFDINNRERARYPVVYGTRLLVDDNGTVKAGQKLAEWDPYTQPIISEREGVANYVDLERHLTLSEQFNEETGITDQVVIGAKKDVSLRPRITLRDDQGEVILLDDTKEARYFLPVGAILSVQDQTHVKPGDLLARVPRASSRTRDITGGLPRVAELFEARKPREQSVMAEINGRIEFGKELKAKRQILIIGEDDNGVAIRREYMVPKRQQVLVQEGDWVKLGEKLVDGAPAPHDILRVLGPSALTDYLSAEIQDVYRLQGVKINDKHIEVIIRQMLNKIEITDAGNSHLAVGDQMTEDEINEINIELVKEDLEPAKFDRVLMGITKSALQTASFISAASFQETTRVLTHASVSGRIDELRGLKENVIVGRLIPAGTGSALRRYQQIARSQDDVAREQQRQIEAEAEALALAADPLAPKMADETTDGLARDAFAAEPPLTPDMPATPTEGGLF